MGDDCHQEALLCPEMQPCKQDRVLNYDQHEGGERQASMGEPGQKEIRKVPESPDYADSDAAPEYWPSTQKVRQGKASPTHFLTDDQERQSHAHDRDGTQGESRTGGRDPFEQPYRNQ